MELKSLYDLGKKVIRGVVFTGILFSPSICGPNCAYNPGARPTTKEKVQIIARTETGSNNYQTPEDLETRTQ